MHSTNLFLVLLAAGAALASASSGHADLHKRRVVGDMDVGSPMIFKKDAAGAAVGVAVEGGYLGKRAPAPLNDANLRKGPPLAFQKTSNGTTQGGYIDGQGTFSKAN